MNTKEIEYYQVDTFTTKLFKGNPAGICPLDEWLDETQMQEIAMENNLSETAFYVRKYNYYDIRWFTPTSEVDLCGHATLASAFIEFTIKNISESKIVFKTKRSGDLIVTRQKENICLNFPTDEIKQIKLTEDLIIPFQEKPIEAHRGKSDIVIEFETEEEITKMIPNLNLISKLDCRGVIVTAKGQDVDFVSRFFGPQSGIDEDPVTGSAHTTLIPYWSDKLKKTTLTARQLSQRGGDLQCELKGDRVNISGTAKLFLNGKILLT